jgi:sulfite reductase (NADPH) flavoprotein alpha-component
VPLIKARHYSIASSMKLTPRSVHLLVVEVDWQTPGGRKRHGQCTRYLANLRPEQGDVFVTVDVRVGRATPPPPREAHPPRA